MYRYAQYSTRPFLGASHMILSTNSTIDSLCYALSLLLIFRSGAVMRDTTG